MAYFGVTVFLALEYSVSSIGKQWSAAIITAIILWGLAAPATYISIFWGHGGIEAIWGFAAMGYFVMAVGLGFMFTVFDWKSYSEKVLKRELEAIQKHEDSCVAAYVPAETTPILAV